MSENWVIFAVIAAFAMGCLIVKLLMLILDTLGKIYEIQKLIPHQIAEILKKLEK